MATACAFEVIPECEVLPELNLEALSQRESLCDRGKRCIKHPGHKVFYSVDKWKDNLPKELLTDENMESIQNRIDRTVRVVVNYTSDNRPDTYHDSLTSYPFSEYKKTKVRRFGTGYILRVYPPVEWEGSTVPCCCHICKQSEEPNSQYLNVTVRTATHVVFDRLEAEQSTFNCFYDRDDEGAGYTLFGVGLGEDNFESMQSDVILIDCVTCDLDTIAKLLSVFQIDNNDLVNPPAEVIVSHPHGLSKKITVGKIVHMVVPVKPCYKTNIPFDFPCPTLCRVPLKPGIPDTTVALPVDFERVYDSKSSSNNGDESIPVPNSTLDNLLEIHARLDGKSIHPLVSRLKRFVDKAKILGINEEMIKPFLSIIIERRESIQSRKDALDVAIEFRVMDNFRSFKDQNGIVLEAFGIDHVKTFINAVFSENQSPENAFYRMRMKDSDFVRWLENKKHLVGDSHILYDIRRGTDRLQDYLDDKMEDFKTIADFILEICTFVSCIEQQKCYQKKISPGDFVQFLKKHLTKNTKTKYELDEKSEKEILEPSKSPAKLLRVKYKNAIAGIEYLIPSDMTFTLPQDAEYAFLYQCDSPGWFTFPPGTKFISEDGKECFLAAEVEFKNNMRTEQSFLMYDIPTCPGSSGATVYCDLIKAFHQEPYWHHLGAKKGKSNRSGLHNTIDTTLLNVFKHNMHDKEGSHQETSQWLSYFKPKHKHCYQ